MHGTGTFMWADGNSYEGEWEEGVFHGTGIMKTANGDIYEGEYERGEKHGKGRYTWRNGATYVGDYCHGFRTGFGIFAYDKTGIRQEGQWVNGKFQGSESPDSDSAKENDAPEEDKENAQQQQQQQQQQCSPLRLIQKSKIPQPVMKTGKLVLPPAPPSVGPDEATLASV